MKHKTHLGGWSRQPIQSRDYTLAALIVGTIILTAGLACFVVAATAIRL